MTKAQKKNAEELLDLLIAKGPALREAGFTEVKTSDLSFSLAPIKPELDLDALIPVKGPDERAMEQEMDALMDPMTYNSEGSVPGYYEQRRQGPASNDNPRTLDDG